MKFVGVDLHKQTISVCVMTEDGRKRKVEQRRSLRCKDAHSIRLFFEQVGTFQVVVEATSSYEWFFLLIEDLADRCVLAHPKKLRVIAESKHKSDKIDAQVLAEFLPLDMIPEAYRPTPRVRQHPASRLFASVSNRAP
jgi:transposase